MDELENIKNELHKAFEIINNKVKEADLLISKNKEIAEKYIVKEADFVALKAKIQEYKKQNEELKNTLKKLELENEQWIQEICRLESKISNTVGDKSVIVGLTNLEKRKEEALFDAINFFGKKCPYCEKELYEGNIRSKIEVDHFIPIARGGQDFPWNIIPACKQCNRKKRDRNPEEFLDKEKFEKIKNYLDSIKEKITNSVLDDLQNYEIIKNVFKTNFDKLRRIKELHPILQMLSLIAPKSEDNENREDLMIDQILNERVIHEINKPAVELKELLLLMKNYIDDEQNFSKHDNRTSNHQVIDYSEFTAIKRTVEKYGVSIHRSTGGLAIVQNHPKIMQIINTGKGYHHHLEKHKGVILKQQTLNIDSTTKRCTIIDGVL